MYWLKLLLITDIPRPVSRMRSWQGIESTLSAELVCHYMISDKLVPSTTRIINFSGGGGGGGGKGQIKSKYFRGAKGRPGENAFLARNRELVCHYIIRTVY